jgi:hypothetical protein
MMKTVDVSGVTENQLVEARGWLLDCGCSEELLAGRDAVEIVREVEYQYDGGWAQFVEDGS